MQCFCNGVVASYVFNIVSGDERMFAVHCSSGHESLEGCMSKSQQGQQNVVPRVTAEETSHQRSKSQLMVPEIGEMGGEKCKTSHDSNLSVNKRRNSVSESASVEKTVKREVKLSKNPVSKDKCEVSQAVPYNSSVSEIKKDTKSSPKYIGVRKASLHCYTTIGKYFGKDFNKTEDEIQHDRKDCAKNLREKEFTSSNQKLVYEHKCSPSSRNHGEVFQLMKTKNLPTEGVILPVGTKDDLDKVAAHQHRSKSLQNIKRRRSEDSQLFSKVDVKRRCSYGGEEAAALGVSVNKGPKMRPMGNDIKSRKSEEKTQETKELPKTVSHVDVHRLCMKYKKRKRILELFGEDPDEPAGKKSYSSDRVGMKVLQGISISKDVSNCFDECVTHTSTSELDTRQKGMGSRVSQPSTFSHKRESETSSFIKATVRHSGENKTKESVDQQSTSSHHEGGVQKEGSQKSTQFIHSVQQSNCSKQAVCGSMKNIASDATVQQNNDQQSCVTSNRNILHIADPKIVVLDTDTVGGSDHQKSNECGGHHELGSSSTCSMKEGTDSGTLAPDDRLKDHKSDIHLTGSIQEGKSGEFHLIINMGNIDVLFPSPERGQSGTGVKMLSSVDCCVAKDVNEAASGQSANMDDLVSAEQCIENADVPLNTVEKVAEERVASAGSSENVAATNTPEVAMLSGEETLSGGTLNVPHSACAEQNPLGNHLHTVTSTSSEAHTNSMQGGRGSITDSASESQVLNTSAVTEKIQDQALDIYAGSGSSHSLPEEDCKEMEMRKEKGTGKGIMSNKNIQRKPDMAGKSKCLPESNAVLAVASSKESSNISPSAVDHNQIQSCAALETNISNSGEPSSSGDSQSSVRSDQLPNRLLDDNSLTTSLSQSVVSPPTSRSTNDIPDVVGVPASQTARIRVRDPVSLGITCPQSPIPVPISYFENMDTKLRELTEVTYVLLQDIDRFKQRREALSCLTGSLRATEWRLAMAEFANPHQAMKIKSFLSLYRYIETRCPGDTENFLIRRLNELNPAQRFTSEHVKRCWNYCSWVARNCQENSHNISGQATVSSSPYQQQYQQQPVGVPSPNNVSGNANNLLATLVEGGRRTSLSSEENLNSEQQSFPSGERVASVAQIQHTAGRKTVINTAGVVTKPASYDMRVREAGTNLNTRHAEVRYMLRQPPPYNPSQAGNSSGTLQSHSNSNPHVPQLVPADNRTIPPNPYVPQTVPATGRTILPNPYVPQTVPATDRAILPSPYVPHSVAATDRIIPLAQVPVSSTPSQTAAAHRLLPPAYREQRTVLPAVTNSVVSHGNGSAVAGCASGYSQPSVSVHSYPPRQHGSSSFNTPNTLYSHNRTTQQSTSTQRNNDIHQNTNPRVTYPNGSTQVGRFLYVVNQNTVLNKSASRSFSQPYSQNTAEQQNTFSQAVRNSGPHTFTATGFSQQYPQNSVQQGTLPHVNNVFPLTSASNSYSYSYPRNETVQQGTFSQPMSSTFPGMSTDNSSSQSYTNNVAVTVPGRAPNPFGYLNQQNQASTYHLSNGFPLSSLTGRAQNVLLNAGPTREIYGYAHQTRSRFHSPSSNPAQLPKYSQSVKQMLLQAEQQVNVCRGNRGDEHRACVSQGNGGVYHRVLCGLLQQQQAPPVVSGSELQLCGTPQSVSNRRGSNGKENSNVTASNNFCDGRDTQNVPAAGGVSYRENNQSRYLGNSTASNSLSGMGNSEGLSLASTAAGDRLSDGGRAEIEPASSSLSDKRYSEGLSHASTTASDRLSDGGSAQIEPASSSMSDKQNSEGLSLASTAASDRLSDGGSAQIEPASSNLSRRENNCVAVANSRATSILSDTGNNQRSGFAANNTTNNGVFDSGSNKTPPLASTTINDSVGDRGNNHSESSKSAAGDGLSGGGSIHSGPPPVVDIPSLVPLQSRLKGINQQSNRLAEKMSACDAGKHIMSSVAQDDMSVVTSTPSTENRSIDINNGLIESYSISEATPMQNPQLEMHSNITISSVSQTLSRGIQHSSRQRHLSDTVTTQPVLTNSTPVVTVQASENQGNVPSVLRQENGKSSTIHSMQKTLNLHGCELLNTHVTHIAAESEPPEKTVPGDESTRDTLRTGHHETLMLRTYRKKTSDPKSRNQSATVEVFGHTNDVQNAAAVRGVQDTCIVENVVWRQDKCGVDNGIPQKCSSPNYLSDPGTGVGSDVAGEDVNSSSAKVMSGLLEERQVTILADVRVHVTEEATGTENNREREPEIEVVSCMLGMFPLSVLSAVYCSEVLFMHCLHEVHTLNILKGDVCHHVTSEGLQNELTISNLNAR